MKTKSEILKDLLDILHDIFQIETDEININTNIFDGGIALDSIQMIELTVAIEEFYGFEFSDETLTEDNFRNFDVLTSVIKTILDGERI